MHFNEWLTSILAVNTFTEIYHFVRAESRWRRNLAWVRVYRPHNIIQVSSAIPQYAVSETGDQISSTIVQFETEAKAL